MNVDRRHLCEANRWGASARTIFAASVAASSQHTRFVRNYDPLTMEGERMSTRQFARERKVALAAGSAAVVDMKVSTPRKSVPKGKVPA